MTKKLHKRVMRSVKDFVVKQNRGTIVEYVLIVTVMAIGIIGGLTIMKQRVEWKLHATSGAVVNTW